jgi:hypothetical protein
VREHVGRDRAVASLAAECARSPAHSGRSILSFPVSPMQPIKERNVGSKALPRLNATLAGIAL